MAEVKSLDVTEGALELLLPQFKEKNIIESIIKGVSAPYQEVVDTSLSIIEKFNIDTDNPALLNLIGKLLNIPRGQETDEEYRQKIQTQVLINRSTGSAGTLLPSLDRIVGVGQYKLTEQFPAEVSVRIYSQQQVLTKESINALLPIGVNGVFFQNPYVGKIPWETSDVATGENNVLAILPEVADLATTDVVMIDVVFT